MSTPCIPIEPNIIASIVATTTITEEQDFRGIRIVKDAVGQPPKANTGNGKFRSIVARSDGEISDIVSHIIESMRNGHAVSRRTEIMIVDMDLLLGIEPALSVEITDQLFFLTSMLIAGLPFARASSSRFSMFLNCSSRFSTSFPASFLKALRLRKSCLSNSCSTTVTLTPYPFSASNPAIFSRLRNEN